MSKKESKELIGKFMFGKLEYLLGIKDTGRGRSVLADLRRGVGKVPGELPQVWGIFLNELPEVLVGKRDGANEAEWAVYISLTLFALHQQGSAEPVHRQGAGLGKAVYALMGENSEDERERVMRRFAPIITAKGMKELSWHLRSITELFRSQSVQLDYVQLAKDIYDFQFAESRKNVQLRWARDFYHNNNNKGEE